MRLSKCLPIHTTHSSNFQINVILRLLLKFMYSKEATKFCEISIVDLSYVHSNGLIGDILFGRPYIDMALSEVAQRDRRKLFFTK